MHPHLAAPSLVSWRYRECRLRRSAATRIFARIALGALRLPFLLNRQAQSARGSRAREVLADQQAELLRCRSSTSSSTVPASDRRIAIP